MAIGYPPQENRFLSEADALGYDLDLPVPIPGGFKIDGVAIAAVALLLFLGFQLLNDRSRPAEQVVSPETSLTTEKSRENYRDPILPESAAENSAPVPAPLVPDPSAIIYPYDDYWLTQGPHGFSYGHMAIDIAAGKGSAIKSPIQGLVAANYVDQYGNTTLIVENERYQVTLLHGNYSVAVGQPISLGELIGSEGNNGYTTDMYGNSCRGRECGYHTHINVFDIGVGQNVNPLDILGF